MQSAALEAGLGLCLKTAAPRFPKKCQQLTGGCAIVKLRKRQSQNKGEGECTT